MDLISFSLSQFKCLLFNISNPEQYGGFVSQKHLKEIKQSIPFKCITLKLDSFFLLRQWNVYM